MKTKTSKKINQMICGDLESTLDWSMIANFVVLSGIDIMDISFEDAFDIGLNAQRGYEIGVDEDPVYRVNGKYGIYFFIGKEPIVIKALKKFIEEK